MEGVTSHSREVMERYSKVWLNTTIIDAFEKTCDILPEKEALVEGDLRLTFSQLMEKTRRAALGFIDIGIRKEDVVLLQIPNYSEAVYVYMGLQMIGAVPLVCLPRHGIRELEQFAALTGARTWIGPDRYGSSDYLPMIHEVKAECPSLTNIVIARGDAPTGTLSLSKLMEGARIGPESDRLLTESRPSPNDVIHLAPTGGSTGLPKLVPKTHNGHLCKAYYWGRAMERGPGDVSLLLAPINHDAPHVAQFTFMALFGGKIIFGESMRPKDILEYLEKEKISYCFIVPTLMNDILNEKGLRSYTFSSELRIGTGGAAAPPDLVKAFTDQFNCRFYNTYGMTEGAGTITRSTDSFEVIAGTVGRKMCPYDELKIVDDDGHELPQGQSGEIAARGPCIVAGYYKKKDEDKEAFTREGLFRTGDLGKFDAKGNLIITGRKKDLIKRGGENIIPAEIEELIRSHPKVVQTAVVGMPDERLGERICAYIQTVPGEERITFDELIPFLKDKGASHMLLPERLEFVAEFPLTAAQKLDKQALRKDIAEKIREEQSDT